MYVSLSVVGVSVVAARPSSGAESTGGVGIRA